VPLAASRIKRLGGEAAAFADEQIRKRKAFPAERQALIAAFARAAEDDATAPTVVTFGEGKDQKTGGRVDLLRSVYASRTPHELTVEQIVAAAGEGGQALMNQSTTPDPNKPAPPTTEEYERLMNATPLGEAVLRAKKAAAGK
jgi:hypothetical protein